MNGEEVEEEAVKLKITGTKKRKKKDVGDTDYGREKRRAKSRKSKSSTASTASKVKKYGCPPKYERITEYICLRYGMKEDQDITGKVIKKYFVTDLENAEKDCKKDSAKLLYFSNPDEAVKIWKWLGKDMFILFSFKFYL